MDTRSRRQRVPRASLGGAGRGGADAVRRRGPITADALQSMPYLHGVVHESLRLWPPGFITGRGCAADVEFDGHHLRQGSLVLYSPWVTHRLEHLWPDAHSFRPERWGTDPLP